MVEKKRDRSAAGNLAAAAEALKKATARLDRVQNEAIRRAEAQVARDLATIGEAAVTAAMTRPEFRETLLATMEAGKLMSRDAMADMLVDKPKSTLTIVLQAIPSSPVTQEVEPPPQAEAPRSLPAIATDNTGVIRYTALRGRSMTSGDDVNDQLMKVLEATYVDDIKCWASAHPAFEQTMKSLSRFIDHHFDGLQPDIAVRLHTITQLESEYQYIDGLPYLRAMVEWEDIASSDNWMPNLPAAYVYCSHSESTSEYPNIAALGEAERERYLYADDNSSWQVESWGGTWLRAGTVVSVEMVRQDLTLDIWRRRTAEARQRLAEGTSARPAWERRHREQLDADERARWDDEVRMRMTQRRQQFGKNA